MSFNSPWSRFRSLSLALCFAAQIASAFPPAPGFTISGNVRDQFGWAFRPGSEAIVMVIKDGRTVAEASVGEALQATKNFKVVVPMDPRIADAYVKDAHPPGVQFALQVKLGEQIYPITNLTVTEKLVSEIGGKVTVDFSIAEDSDGDGIPDSWERWQLSEAGMIGIEDPLGVYSRNGDFDKDGTSDYLEYLAGTFAFLSEETLSLEIVEDTSADWLSLKAFLVAGKSYQIESSTDLKKWQPVPFRPEGALASNLSLKGEETQEFILETPKVVDAEKRVFRLRVR